MNKPVNYKNKRKYKTAKYPIRQPRFFTWLIWVLSKIMLWKKPHKTECVDMEEMKAPYLLLSNHMSFVDFELIAEATYPQRMNNVVNIDGYYMRAWLLEWIGAICTRKFTSDIHLVKSIRRVLQRGDVLTMYPEARYSPCGTTSFLPDSLGMLVHMCKVPVVVAIHHGNYLHAPFWNYRQKRRVPMHTVLKPILTAEEAATLPVAEINARLKDAFQYDEYRYWQESGFLITEAYRAEGMHKILYQCPNCKTEHQMDSQGAEIFCRACGKRWTLLETGFLQANEGETEFTHVPDWFEWERENVRREVRDGTYHFEDEVDVYSMPRCYRFMPLGRAKVVHDIQEGFVLEGFYRGEEYRIQRVPLAINSLHVEYDFPHIKPFDCFDISTEEDSFYCYPTKENVLTKLAFATEEIFQLHYERTHNKRHQ